MASALPVGVTRTLIPSGRSRRRHPYFVAHIGAMGLKWARSFSVNVHGEDGAFRLALDWRERMEKSLRRALRRPHGKIGKPGVRGVYRGRAAQ